MKPIHQAARILLFLGAGVVYATALAPTTYGQNASLGRAGSNPLPSLMQQMVGTWNVQQRMWPGSGAEAINLPLAVAHRRLIGGAFLEELMTLAPEANSQRIRAPRK